MQDNVVDFKVVMTNLMSGEWQKIANAAHRAGGTIHDVARKIKGDVDGNTKSIDAMRQKLNELTKVRDISINRYQVKAAQKEIEELEKKIGKVTGGGKGGGGGMSLMGLVPQLAPVAIAAAAAKLGMDSVGAAMQFGLQTKSFETLTGDTKRGQELAAQLRELKQTTIMGPSVYKNAQTMMAFGIGDNEVVADLKRIGDIAMGDVDRMQSLTLAFSQTRSAGKLMGQDLLQYINAGFNPLQVMSERWKEFGFKQKVTVGQLRDLMSEDKISADMVTRAFELATSKGGMFYNMMERLGNTTAGQAMKLKGNWAAFQIDLGNALMPVASDVLRAGTDILHMMNLHKSVPETLMAENKQMNYLASSITGLNEHSRLRIDLLQKLKDEYPEYFSKIDVEKTKNRELLETLEKVNRAYRDRLPAAMLQTVSDNKRDEAQKKIAVALRFKSGANTVLDNLMYPRLYGDQLLGTGIAAETLYYQGLKELGVSNDQKLFSQKIAKNPKILKDIQALLLNGKDMSAVDAQKLLHSVLYGDVAGGDATKNSKGATAAGVLDKAEKVNGGGVKNVTVNVGKLWEDINITTPNGIEMAIPEFAKKTVQAMNRVLYSAGAIVE